MSQSSSATPIKSSLRVIEARSYSQNPNSDLNANLNSYSHRQSPSISGFNSSVANGEEESNSKINSNKQVINQTQKTVQFVFPPSKPQPSNQTIEQVYKEKLQDLETRMGEENQYLREAAEVALRKL